MGSYGWISGLIQGGINAGLTSDTLKNTFKQQRDMAQATEVSDRSLMTSAMQTISRLNVERAGAHRATSNALFAVQAQKQQFQGTVAAGAAATGSIGNSVQAAMSDADAQASKAVASILNNQDVQDARIYEQQADIRTRTGEGFRAHTLSPVMSRWDSQWTVFKAFASGFMGSGGASVSDTMQYQSPKGGGTADTMQYNQDTVNAFSKYGTSGGGMDGYRGSDMSFSGSY